MYGSELNQRAGSAGGISISETRIVKLRAFDALGNPLEKVSLQAGGLFKLPVKAGEPTLVGPASRGTFKEEKGYEITLLPLFLL